jgi:hypothetical protein
MSDIIMDHIPETDPEVLDSTRVEEPSSPQVDIKDGVNEFTNAEQDLKNIIDTVCAV